MRNNFATTTDHGLHDVNAFGFHGLNGPRSPL
jgi:hypothetical protein